MSSLVVVSTINGDSNIGYFGELAAQGISAEAIPVLSTSVGEDELRSLLPSQLRGHMSAWSYFQSVETGVNREFVNRFKGDYGFYCVTNDPIEAAYSQVFLWKLAAERAGSFDVDLVREAFQDGIEFESPGGKIKFDAKTQHTYKRFRLGKVREDRQFDIVYESDDWIAPEPLLAVAFPRSQCDWTQDGVTCCPQVELEL